MSQEKTGESALGDSPIRISQGQVKAETLETSDWGTSKKAKEEHHVITIFQSGKCPTDSPTGQSDVGSSSVEVTSSQVTTLYQVKQ